MNTIIERFHATVQRYPNEVALITHDTQLSYTGLLAHVNATAAALHTWFLAEQHRAISPSDKIGLSLKKGVDLYIAILAILTTGACYVPIDPTLNEQTRLQLSARCRCDLVVTPDWMENNTDLTVADETGRPAPNTSIVTDIVYTLFTSGSTGRPKGVNVTHLNVLNLVDWAINAFELGPGARVLQYSTINFDASVLDVFPTLLSGGALCIPTEDARMSEMALAAFCRRHAVTQAFLPPPLLAVFDAGRFSGIKTVLTGGESCHPQAIETWSNGRRLYNLYGPTEATVLVSCKAMSATTSAQNIGQPISGVRLHVLDEHQQPSDQGELYVAGLAVSAGYLNDSVATCEKFVNIAQLDASPLYRTGDRVQVTPSGDICFVGRLDRQVKIRGFRVELEEIEAMLFRLGHKEVAVMADPQGSLVAYIVAAQYLDQQMVRDQLGQYLPDYKVPQYVVQLPEMPYKANGKVDPSLLPSHLNSESQPAASTNYGETFDTLAQLWAAELKLPVTTFRQESNFRELGGSSINIMHLLSNLETSFGVVIDFIDFLEQPTLRFLMHALDNRNP
ncbi:MULTISPECIES: non-ribosomal peptide synthetase [Pseudomonas syringae group]|uniref:Non-ribosomal peptide synthetase n=5 Tax=Pseudomonas syringae group TaxID=136849 RepID=F3GHH8_PSESJ|nr:MULTISPECIES: non-ribosomal peptide synthetase [Pseudomonas syringae group]EGH46531.1 non-ribosomal peptide synthetase [Pseudomonas syringae pv. pisi str. 1704B]AZG84947.1 amino acid adenylation domain-containing protein [Pseudomonas syringae pv. pisi str. PP1]EKG29702.1 non-ribosomal peptide synthetase [Pseudomonas avellanae BPIC 631]PYD09329.1 amino acid adenylation domain-containing protein [Pseudomonas syringae pv. pisi]PYD26998.1 amino acid adenylation domain-containing protein [Pseudo